MKLFANAHVSRLMIEFLRAEGHDCLHADVVARGMTDDDLLRLAVDDGRVILTADKDFGELVFRRMVPAAGVILLRLHAASEEDRLTLLRKHWPAASQSAAGHFVVVSNRRVRRTPLPGV